MPISTRIFLALLLLLAGGTAYFQTGGGDPTATPAAARVGERLGGAGSRAGTDEDAFALPMANLPAGSIARFFEGQRLFNLNWVRAPSPVEDLDGLGPTFNRVGCARCHVRDGRGRPPAGPDAPFMSIVLKLGLVAKSGERSGGPATATGDAPRGHPAYGIQLNDRANPGIPPEGRASVVWLEDEGRYGDNTVYRLRRPRITLRKLAFGPIGPETRLSLRIAPQLIGLGLLGAVPDAEILKAADPDDRNRDGIRGRPNRVVDKASGKLVLGRFGWKATQPSIAQQSADAFLNDMGLTTALYPRENCPPPQAACRAAPNGGAPEVGARILADIAFYVGHLAVPLRIGATRTRVRYGEALFHKAGCAACHRPTLRTGPSPLPALANQTIHPYTDLLLHDMGPGLADGIAAWSAGGRDWRTAPLWGLGRFRLVNGHAFYLHDGRARSLAEAILWHGGEARRAREHFRMMKRSDRESLIAFLRSL